MLFTHNYFNLLQKICIVLKLIIFQFHSKLKKRRYSKCRYKKAFMQIFLYNILVQNVRIIDKNQFLCGSLSSLSKPSWSQRFVSRPVRSSGGIIRDETSCLKKTDSGIYSYINNKSINKGAKAKTHLDDEADELLCSCPFHARTAEDSSSAMLSAVAEEARFSFEGRERSTLGLPKVN